MLNSLRSAFSDLTWAFKTAWQISPRLSAIYFTSSLLHGLLPVLEVIATRFLLDELVKLIGNPNASLSGASTWLLALFIFSLLDLITLLLGGRYILKRLEDELNTVIASQVMEHASKLPLSLFEDLAFQDTLERAQQNIALNFTIFLRSFVEAATGSIQIALLFALLLSIEPLMILIALIAIPPYGIIMASISRRRYQNEYQRAPERRWTRYFTELMLSRDYATEIRFLGIGGMIIERFRNLMKQFAKEDAQIEYRALLASIFFAMITLSLFFYLFYRLLERVSLGGLSLGDVAILGGAIAKLSSSAETVVAKLGLALERSLHVSNLRAYLAIPVQEAKPTEKIRLGGKLEFRDVSFRYPEAEENVLSNLSFVLEEGETLAIVGENGAGKTTIIKLIARIYEPQSGAIFLDGRDLKTLSPSTIYENIAFILQNFGRYEATAAENIAYGNPSRYLSDKLALQKLVRDLEMQAMIESMPQSYETFLGRRFGKYEPSGGQWQQLAIARSFAHDASLLILDEPTASLDARTEATVFSRFIKLSQGRTRLIISHRFTTVSMADRILVLDGGEIVEQGKHEDLLKNTNGLYAQLYRLHYDKQSTISK
jgi:ATP-binding cassette subfamily B protein